MLRWLLLLTVLTLVVRWSGPRMLKELWWLGRNSGDRNSESAACGEGLGQGGSQGGHRSIAQPSQGGSGDMLAHGVMAEEGSLDGDGIPRRCAGSKTVEIVMAIAC